MQDMAGNGVKHIVYYLYPHLSPTGGGLCRLRRRRQPGRLRVAEARAQLLRGVLHVDYDELLSAGATVPGYRCVVIDTIPAFNGHNADTSSLYMVYPNAMPERRSSRISCGTR